MTGLDFPTTIGGTDIQEAGKNINYNEKIFTICSTICDAYFPLRSISSE
ncbi:hypothetical protein BRDCF_p273 [Bacteroidales bacterium CF]|nr:hypothetical protein BRDCF_p273 [Bacteroidales bacterium CF]